MAKNMMAISMKVIWKEMELGSILIKVNQKRFGKKGKKMEKPEKFFLMEIYMK